MGVDFRDVDTRDVGIRDIVLGEIAARFRDGRASR